MDEQISACDSTETTIEGCTMSHNDLAVNESGANLEVSNYNIFNTEISAEGMDADSLEPVHSNTATDFLLSVNESAYHSRSPVNQTGQRENCGQHSLAKETTINGQRKHSGSCDSHEQQYDEFCDLNPHEESQKNTATETDGGINRKDNFVDNVIPPTLPVLSNKRNILITENSLDSSTDSSASFHSSKSEMYSFLNPNNQVEDNCNVTSFQYMRPQTAVNNISGSVRSVNRSLKRPSSNFIKEKSRTSNEFQPIILDVRGGCSEIETEDEFYSLASLEASDNNAEKSTYASHPTENTHSMPHSAFQLLQGMALCAVSSSKKTSEVRDGKASKDFSATETDDLLSDLAPIASQANASSTFRKQSLGNKSQLYSATVGLNTNTTLSSRKQKKSTSGGLQSIPVSIKVNTLPSSSSKVMSNCLVPNVKGSSYSCVFVQDKDTFKQGQMAFLIPQSSLPSLSNVSSLVSSDSSTKPVTVGQTRVKNVHSGQICSPSSSWQEIFPSSSMPVPESISKLVTNTMNSFFVHGKDLKESNLLKVTAPKRIVNSQNAVCLVCSEVYCDEEGLNFHLERTAFHLTFYCSFCKKNIVFFNKCSLWTHLKSESDRPILNYSNIVCLKPYEFDTDDGSENEVSRTVESETVSETVSEASSDTTCSIKDLDLPATRVTVEAVPAEKSVDPCIVPESLTPSSNIEQTSGLSKCPVCLDTFVNLKAHLCSAIRSKCLCPTCGMFLPSTCAQEAHKKIHSGLVKDMSCPECGKADFSTDQESADLRSVFDHVDSCRHFNRVLDLKCFCTQPVTNVNQLLKHFTDRHCRTLFKCPFCVLAFTQSGHLVGHLDKAHKLEGVSTKASVLCLFCQQIIKSVEELKEHVNQHIEQFKNKSVFKWRCFICSKLFDDKVFLNIHLELDHPQKYKRCTICYSLFWSRKNLVEHIVQKKCLRMLAQKLNVCVDHQPEVSEQAMESLDFNKVFEVKKVVSGKLGQFEAVSLGKTHLVNIAPKPASSQLVANKESSQLNQQNCLQKVLPAVSTASCKLIITRNNSTEAGKHNNAVTSINQCVVCRKITDSEKLLDHLKSHQRQGIIICHVCQRRDFKTMEDALAHAKTCFHKRSEAAENQKGLEPQSSSSSGVVTGSSAQGGQVDVNPDSGQVDVDANRVQVDVDANRGQVDTATNSGQVDVDTNSRQLDVDTKSGQINVDTKSGQVDVDTNKQSEAQAEKISMDNQSVFPCLLCGLAFHSLSAREKHVSRSHDGTRIVYHCGICRKRGKASIFSKKELAARHITKKHRIVNRDAVNRLIRTEEQNASSGQKVPASEPAPEEADNVSPPKRLRVAGEGDYMCGKCGFSCCLSDEFSQHITCHNLAQEPQCPECGLCFTILLALKKHLLAVHKIKAVDDYLKMKNITENALEEEDWDILPDIHHFGKTQPEPADTVRGKSNAFKTKVSSSNPLECTVCYKAFDNEANLKTHMRNHGMAFIRSKRHKQY